MGFLPLIIYIYISFNEIKRFSIDKTGVSLQRTASETATRMELLIEDKLINLSGIAKNDLFTEIIKRKSEPHLQQKYGKELDSILDINKDIVDIIIIGKNKKVYFSRNDMSEEDISSLISDETNRDLDSSSEDIYIRSISFIKSKMRLLADVIVPIRESGSLSGYCLFKINLKGILYLSKNAERDDIGTSLVRSDGKLIYDSHESLQKDSYDYHILKDIIRNKNGWQKILDISTGKVTLTGFSEIEKIHFYDSANKKYYILLSIEERAALSPIMKSYYKATLMGIIIILFIILVALFDVNKIIFPIESLTKGAEMIGTGNLDYNMEFKTGDEIEDLSRAFKSMSQNLRVSRIKSEEQKNKLEKLNELKSNFLSMVSHELRTPLMIMQESVSQILDGIKGPITEEQRDYLLMTKRNIQRLNKIIEDLLNISKIESGKISFRRKKINISKTIISEIELYIYKAKEREIEFNFHIPHKDIVLYCDEGKIKIILDNLVNNAIKFTPDKGTIDVSLFDNINEIELIVSDSGQGIPAEYHSKIFEKFEKLNNKPLSGMPSTGLGLAISKEFVILHKGKIWVESEIGKGCHFHVVLPKYTENRYFKEYFEEKMKEADEKQVDLSLIVLRLSSYEKVYVDSMQKRKVFSNLINISFNNIFDYEEIIPLKNMDEIYAFLFTDAKGAEIILERLNRLVHDFLEQKKLKETFLVTILPLTYREDGNDAKSLLKTAGRLLSYIEPLRKKTRKIGEMLIEKNIISTQDIQWALQKQEKTGQMLGAILIDENKISSDAMAEILSKQLNLPIFEKESSINEKKLFKILPKEFIIKHKCFPVECKEGALVLAMVNPFDVFTIKKIYKITGCQAITMQMMLESDFEKIILNI
jgi:signal transduction histidine kinase